MLADINGRMISTASMRRVMAISDLTPHVAKYADNGLARRRDELDAYFKAYRNCTVLDYLKKAFEKCTEDVYRKYI
jgi:hypothetical protein